MCDRKCLYVSNIQAPLTLVTNVDEKRSFVLYILKYISKKMLSNTSETLRKWITKNSEDQEKIFNSWELFMKNINRVSEYGSLSESSKVMFNKVEVEENNHYFNKLNESYVSIKIKFPKDILGFRDTAILKLFSKIINTIPYPLGSTNTLDSKINVFLEDSNSKKRLLLDKYLLTNQKGMPEFIVNDFINKNNKFRKAYTKSWDETQQEYRTITLFKHQKFVTNFLNENSPYRGLLLYHGLGSGKSGASISIAEGYKDRKVIVMLPASLKNNYVREIQTFGDISYRKNYHWCYISLTQLKGKPLEESEMKVFKVLQSFGIPLEVLHNYVISPETSIIINRGDSKPKGVWLIDLTRQNSNYELLSLPERKEIDKTVNNIFKYKYTFIHYNGGASVLESILKLIPNYSRIRQAVVGNMKGVLDKKNRIKVLNYILDKKNTVDGQPIENPFDNKVVVVDEIHNLMSMVAGSGFNGPLVYKLLMLGKNTRLVALSGTPGINKPYELALLFNLLKGVITTYTIMFQDDSPIKSKEEIVVILDSIEEIDRVEYISERQVIKGLEFTRYPKYFTKKTGHTNYVTKSDRNDQSDAELIESIKEQLRKHSILIQDHEEILYKHYTLFDDDIINSKTSEIKQSGEEKFMDLYVTTDELGQQVIKQSELFKSRIYGLTSYFCETTAREMRNYDGKDVEVSVFPKVIMKKPYLIPLSDYQLNYYIASRKIEYKLEKRSLYKRKKGQVML